MKVDVVHPPGEVEGKSTAVHAKLVSPGSVDIHIYPNCPDYREERALLVFPDPESRTLEQLKFSGDGDNTPFPYGELRPTREFLPIYILLHFSYFRKNCIHRQHVEPVPQDLRGPSDPRSTKSYDQQSAHDVLEISSWQTKGISLHY